MAENWPEMVVEWPTHNFVTVFLKQTLEQGTSREIPVIKTGFPVLKTGISL